MFDPAGRLFSQPPDDEITFDISGRWHHHGRKTKQRSQARVRPAARRLSYVMAKRPSAKPPSAFDVTVGRNVRIWRMAKGLSQAQLASRLGITFQQVQKYEIGANRIGTGRLVKISSILGVPIAALFEGTGAADPSSALIALISDSRSFRLAHAFAAIKHNAFRLSLVELVEKIAAGEAAKRGRK